MDVEACHGATFAEDTSFAPSSIYPIADTASCVDNDFGCAYTDDDSGCAISAYDIMATPGYTTSSMGAPDMPSSVRSPMHAAIG